MLQFTESIPLSLYIHLPWCVRKCPYCDFNSHASGADSLPESAYIAALLSDLEADLPRIWGRRIETVFIGGGTPSLFSPAAIDNLLSAVRARVLLRPDTEITLEANPGTVEKNKFAEFKAIGINRLSIGIQSFHAEQLSALGRIHGRAEAIAAAEAAQAIGINFNLDLMYGLPGQTLVQARADVSTALALQPDHLSYYQLTLEPNTLFHKYPPADLPNDEALWDYQLQGQALLAEAGFQHYEISAYARPGKTCAHNLNYWQFGDYLGIGAGAHGKITDFSTGAVFRLLKPKHPRTYLQQTGQINCSYLTKQDLPLEFMLNALRLPGGFAAELFSQRTGLDLSCIAEPLQQAELQGLLSIQPDWIAPTELGQRFLNDLLALFLPHGA